MKWYNIIVYKIAMFMLFVLSILLAALYGTNKLGNIDINYSIIGVLSALGFVFLILFVCGFSLETDPIPLQSAQFGRVRHRRGYRQ